MIGQTVGHYRICASLGRGGLGIVYQAEDMRLQRVVALKFLPAEMAGDKASLERFQREARAASALNHPGICTVHEIDPHAGQHFIAMELLEGETLADRIHKGPFEVGPPRRAAPTLRCRRTSGGGLTAMVSSLNKRREIDAIKVSVDLTVSGFQSRASDAGQVADIVENVETRGPDGQRLPALSKDEIERYQGPAAPAYTFSTTLTMDPGNAPGTYRILLSAHDMIGGGQVTQEAVFEFP